MVDTLWKLTECSYHDQKVGIPETQVSKNKATIHDGWYESQKSEN